METESLRGDTGEGDDDKTNDKQMLYCVTDVPPWHLCILLGLQQSFMALCGCFGLPLLVAPHLCMTGDTVGISELIGTVTFASGICTLIQTFVGIRLPIVQGPSAAYIIPLISLMSLPDWRCPQYNSSGNHTLPEPGSDEHKAVWKLRQTAVQGDIMVASIFQMVVGFSGLMTFVLRFIGPLTVAATITTVALSLIDFALHMSSSQWWIALLTAVLIVLFSQYINKKEVPCIGWNKKDGFYRIGLPLFGLFPVLLALAISWMLCFILTEAQVFTQDPKGWGYGARTDIKADVLTKSQWFRFPYPGQWGVPVVSLAGVIGMMSASLASTIESIGDYYACARLSGAPPPPRSAVGRGIFAEGIGCLLTGALGAASGTTSYSHNIAAIGITKVGSRVVALVTGLLLIVLGCFGKFGALFVAMPDPVVGGMFLVVLGMVAGVGLSNLQAVNLHSVRNVFILGLSLFLGLGIPRWVKDNADKIKTGSDAADQMLCVVLGTSMLVAGVLAALLDNTIPGTDEERGINQWRQEAHLDTAEKKRHVIYDIPYIQKYLNKWACSKYIPILPNFVHKTRKKDKCITECEMDKSTIG